MTAHSDLENAVAAYKGGAFEYLPKPFDIDEAVELVRKAARVSGQASPTKSRAAARSPSMIGQAPAMQEVFRSIGRLAGSSMTVLITGESGTGKELVARALHDHSPRANKPFIALNTSAIAAELLESELFGHEKGAFTGADARARRPLRAGRRRHAVPRRDRRHVTCTADATACACSPKASSIGLAAKRSINVDVRVIAATNQDLARAVKESRFREDLFHRLNVIRINTPPLRQRREDIPVLLTHYLAEAAEELGASAKTLDEAALATLQAFAWPGNVRQLVNATRRLTVTAPGAVITAEDMPGDLGGSESPQRATKEWTGVLAAWAERELHNSDAPLLETALPEFEKTLIETAMSQTKGHRQEAAKLLGWGGIRSPGK